MTEKPHHVELNAARQRIAFALFQQRQMLLDEANRALSEVQAAIDELAAMYAGEAGWEFAQDESGALYLREKSA